MLSWLRGAAYTLQGRLVVAVGGLGALMAGLFSHVPQPWAAIAIALGSALLLVTVFIAVMDVVGWQTRRPPEPTHAPPYEGPVAVRLKNSSVRMTDNTFIGYDTAVDATDSTVEGSGNVVVGPQALRPEPRPNRAARRSRLRTKRDRRPQPPSPGFGGKG